ncbi:hypothetical protein MPER_02885 [Moniliophthora perniciosa FA553]|nr:hypothetical protein MPER_02885 [Moniliophthora perniciosa FA553]
MDSGLQTGIPGTELDDIKTEYHPSSKRATEQVHFTDFGFKNAEKIILPINHEPWKPFPTRFDFEVAELALDCAMNKEQTNRLIGLMERASTGHEKLSFRSHSQLQEIWDTAAEKSAKWQCTEISPTLRNETHSFDVYFRPTGDWIEEVVKNPKITSQNGVGCTSTFTALEGTNWVRFIDEPWTSDLWGDKQVYALGYY